MARLLNCTVLVVLASTACALLPTFFLGGLAPKYWQRRRSKAFEHPFTEGYSKWQDGGGRGWEEIPVVKLSELTHDIFKRKYLLPRRPVIISGVSDLPEVSYEEIVQQCGELPVDFKNRYLMGLMSIPEWLYPYVDYNLQRSFNSSDVGVDFIIKQRKKAWTLASWNASQASSPEMSARPARWDWMLDFAWPLSVHGRSMSRMRELCPLLWEHTKEMRSKIASAVLDSKEVHKPESWKNPDAPALQLYIAPAQTRAYPLHQHGVVNENFLMLAAGRKRAMVFPPSEEAYLLERPEFSTEHGDRVFIAEAFNKTLDFSRHPSLRRARGAEGVLLAGEVLYIPANSIHMVENEESTVAVAFHIDAGARVLGPERGSHLEEIELPSPTNKYARRRHDYYASLGWRLLRSLTSRSPF